MILATKLREELRRRHKTFTISILLGVALIITVVAYLIFERVVQGQLAGERETYIGLRQSHPQALPGWVAANSTAYLRIWQDGQEVTSPDWKWNGHLDVLRRKLDMPSQPRRHLVWFQGMYRMVYTESGPDWGLMCARRENPAWYFTLTGLVIAVGILGARWALDRGFRYLRQPVDREVAFYQKLEQAKETFFAGIFHELGTPLTSLMARLELAMAEIPEGNLRDELAKAYLDGQRIEQLSGDQLLRARFESGRIRLKRNAIFVEDLFVSVVLRLEILCCQQKVAIETEVEPELVIQGDRLRLEQALVNLMTNALKYAPACRTLVLAAHHTGEGVCLEVIDQGRGFDLEALPRLLKPFETQTDFHAKPGTGLGLYLVNEIAKAHGGQLEFEKRVECFAAQIYIQNQNYNP